MEIPEGYTRLTPSTIDNFLTCGLAVQKDQETGGRPFKCSMAVGSAVAEVARTDCETKLFYKKAGARVRGIKIEKARELAVFFYDAELEEAEGVLWEGTTQEDIDIFRHRAADAAQCFIEQASPILDPILTEVALYRTMKSVPVVLAGTPDYVTEEGVGDLKVGPTKKSWFPSKVRAHRQLSLYGILHKAHYGKYPDSVWIDHVYFSAKKGWQFERIIDVRTPRDYSAMLNVVKPTYDAMQKEVYLPPSNGSWKCDRRYCHHFSTCEARPDEPQLEEETDGESAV